VLIGPWWQRRAGGSLFLSETVIAPGVPGPPPHRHARLHDMSYVLEGTLTMQLGDETHAVPAGTFVCVPRLRGRLTRVTPVAQQG
jgi:quercetin dioxygenase-like cupin family protein